LGKKIQRQPGKHSKSKAKDPCKCLRCSKPIRETIDGKSMMICGDEACDLKCDACTERPVSGCGFKPLPVVVEGERMHA
jgi:hypothetical protein